MSFIGLLNKKCTWKRRQNSGINDYGEITLSDVTIGSEVKCARQVGPGVNQRELVGYRRPGDIAKALVTYFLLPTDIQEDDIIKFENSETEIVRNVRDAAGRGHHLEVLAESFQETGEQDQRNT